MCTSDKQYTLAEVYEAIQATIACIQTGRKTWLLKVEDEEGGLRFKISPGFELFKYEIKIKEFGEEHIVNEVNSMFCWKGINSLLRYELSTIFPG